MADLIDRQAAIDALEREKSLVERPITETRWFDFGLRKAQDVLSEVPSAEPEVVRCKDCKYYNPIGVCIEMNCAVCEDSFCCWAERKENG